MFFPSRFQSTPPRIKQMQEEEQQRLQQEKEKEEKLPPPDDTSLLTQDPNQIQPEDEKENQSGGEGFRRGRLWSFQSSAPIPIQGQQSRERRMSAPPPSNIHPTTTGAPTSAGTTTTTATAATISTSAKGTTPLLLPMMVTPPETIRRSFVQVFRPTLEELSKPGSSSGVIRPPPMEDSVAEQAAPEETIITKIEEVRSQEMEKAKEKVKEEETSPPRTPTPVSMMMLRQEF